MAYLIGRAVGERSQPCSDFNGGGVSFPSVKNQTWVLEGTKSHTINIQCVNIDLRL